MFAAMRLAKLIHGKLVGREAGGRLSDAAIKPVPYLVAAPDYSRTVYDRDFLTAPVF